MDKSIFNIRPQFRDYNNPEPSLDELIYHHYRKDFDVDKAWKLTNVYMDMILNELQKMEKER